MSKKILKKDAALSKYSDKNKIKCAHHIHQTEPKMAFSHLEFAANLLTRLCSNSVIPNQSTKLGKHPYLNLPRDFLTATSSGAFV